jgi:hypothetical protein
MIDFLTSILAALSTMLYISIVAAAAIGTILMLIGNIYTRRTGRWMFLLSAFALVVTIGTTALARSTSPWVTWTEVAAIVTVILCLIALLIGNIAGWSASAGQPSKSKSNGS